MKAKGQFKEYEVIGRKFPSEKEPQTFLYKIRITAPDNIVTKSRFCYFWRRLKKFKKTTGKSFPCPELQEQVQTVHQKGIRKLFSYRKPRTYFL